MQPLVKNTALAQAALEHALYFLELGANERAAAYYEFAAQQLQNAAKTLAQEAEVPSLTPHQPLAK